MGFWDAFNFAAFMTMAEEYEKELEEQEEECYEPPAPVQQSTYVPDPEHYNEYGINKLKYIFKDLVDCANRVNNTSYGETEEIVDSFTASILFYLIDSADIPDWQKREIFDYGLYRTHTGGYIKGEFLFGFPDKSLRNSIQGIPKTVLRMVHRAQICGDSKFVAYDFVKCAVDYFLYINNELANKFSHVTFEINIGTFITGQAMEASAELMEEFKPTDDEPEIKTETLKEVFEKGDDNVATVIGAGKYIFGEDIPLGKYTLKAISGNGMFSYFESGDPDDERCVFMGVDKNAAKSYTGLSLESGAYFTLDGNLEVEITRTKKIEIED